MTSHDTGWPRPDRSRHEPRSRPGLLLAGALVAMLAGQRVAAQSGGYVGGGLVVSTQEGHRQGSAPSLPTTGAGGTVVGGLLEGGVRVSDRLALGVELSLPQRFTSIQQTNHLRVFQHESRHRDLAMSGVLRARFVATRRVAVALVGGGGVVQENTCQRRRDQATPFPTVPPVFGPYSADERFTRWTLATVGGADLAVAIRNEVALVPHVRVHVIRRNAEEGSRSWSLGLGTVVVRPGVTLRVLF